MRFITKAAIGLGVVAVLVALAIIGIGFFLSPQDKLRHADLIVAVSGGETSQRTNEAVRVYKEGYAPKLLFSGAAADPNSPSNAAIMRRDAIREGVPASVILIEPNSTTTAQNAADSAPIIRGLGAHTIILVTSPYHQRRAWLSFHQVLGPSVIIINHSASDSAWSKSTWWTKPATIKLTFEELQKIIYIWSTKPGTAGN